MNIKKKLYIVLILIISVLFTISLGYNAYTEENKDVIKIFPRTNQKKLKVGVCESTEYFEYTGTFYNIVNSLQDIGIISGFEECEYENMDEDTERIWEYIIGNVKSDKIEFSKDAYYNLENDIDKERYIQDLKQNELDIVIVLGTYAGNISVDTDTQTDILVFGASNAVASGIVTGTEFSGKSNVWAHVDPDRYKRQIEAFYNIFKFEKLGILYVDSYRKVFAAVDDVKEVAKEKGFEVVEETMDFNEDMDKYYEDVYKAHSKLANKVDAFYLTVGAWDMDKLHGLLEPFYDEKVPVFSQTGDIEVRNGTLIGFASTDFSGIGRFGGEVIEEILKGYRPNEIPQIFIESPRLAINMKIAKKIDYKPDIKILFLADSIY